MKHSGPYQPRLVHEQLALYLPATGTDATGKGLGSAWTRDGGSGTVSHPTPTSGFTTQFRRTRITSTAAINNELGVRNPDVLCWRGNAVKRGGWYFSARFMVNAIPATSIRMFAGLTAGVSAGVCISDTVPNNTVGLWCDAADAADLSIVTVDNAGSFTKTALTTDHDLTTGILYEFVMLGNPNGAPVVTFLLKHDTASDEPTTISAQNVNITMPLSTVFMAPQCGLSNAANAVGGDTSLDIISVYARPHQSLSPSRFG